MTILDYIIANKQQELAENKELFPVKLLEKSLYFKANPVSLKKYLLRADLFGIIAEFKRKSPSKGLINEFANPATVCLGYMQAGASALSVLTDTKFFGGSKNDLMLARKNNYCPILRKDFIIDEYQVIESRSIGADAILLIARVLEADMMASLYRTAVDLGMEVLFEVHDKEDIDKLPPEASLIGINSRNLQDFSVDISQVLQLSGMLPAESVKVAESGIDSPAMYHTLKAAGFNGFLIGEKFMRESSPEKACKQFIKGIKAYL